MEASRQFRDITSRPVCTDCGRELSYDRGWKDVVAEHRTPLDEVKSAVSGTEYPPGVDPLKGNYWLDEGKRKEIDLLEKNKGWSHVGDGRYEWLDASDVSEPASGEGSSWEAIDGKWHKWADHAPSPDRTSAEESNRQVNNLIDAHNKAKFKKIIDKNF